ncbi:hypothetical protein M885DRAFT_518798 [Pelagophyceae sp. CCMP2097]|nr:hypothetical protein M885DRAFT_518798 [Pelagophyceae sp. CCMP2097]
MPPLARLRAAYAGDLREYRRDHRDWSNRLLHKVCVPLELAAMLLFVAGLGPVGRQVVRVAGAAVGLLSAAANPRRPGVLALVFCAGAGLAAAALAPRLARPLRCAAFIEAAAWLAQVCVGHAVFERGGPTLSKQRPTKTAVLLSLLLAWDE